MLVVYVENSKLGLMSSLNQNCESEEMPLAADILRGGGSICIRVLGTSMLPTVWPGDMVTIDAHSIGKVTLGQIVLYETDDRFFVHRLVGKSEVKNLPHLVTRGDSMPQDDPKIARSQLLGCVSSICRNGRTIIPAPRLSPFAGAIGWTMCYSSTLRNLALRLHSFRTRQRSIGIQDGPSLVANNNDA
jgi:Peptidase S24-like